MLAGMWGRGIERLSAFFDRGGCPCSIRSCSPCRFKFNVIYCPLAPPWEPTSITDSMYSRLFFHFLPTFQSTLVYLPFSFGCLPVFSTHTCKQRPPVHSTLTYWLRISLSRLGNHSKGHTYSRGLECLAHRSCCRDHPFQ